MSSRCQVPYSTDAVAADTISTAVRDWRTVSRRAPNAKTMKRTFRKRNANSGTYAMHASWSADAAAICTVVRLASRDRVASPLWRIAKKVEQITRATAPYTTGTTSDTE